MMRQKLEAKVLGGRYMHQQRRECAKTYEVNLAGFTDKLNNSSFAEDYRVLLLRKQFIVSTTCFQET